MAKTSTRPLTVVQILPELQSGGVERGTLETGAYLVGQGHRSIVISGGGRMVPELQAGGSRHIAWPYIGEKSPRCLQYIWPLRRLLQRHRVAVLHLRSRLPAWIGYLAWRSLPSNRRPRLVTTFHGFYSVNRYSAIMTKGEKIIAVSNTIARHIQQAYGIPPERVVTIYRGFDENVFDPARVSPQRLDTLRRQWGRASAAGPIILMPGRITRLKGHDMLFESLACLKAYPWYAVCVGDTALNPGLAAELERKLIALGLEERVKLAGLCNDMPAAFMLADIVVAPSIKPESFGRIVVEAQAMGRPVIAAAHGGSLETVQDRHTGWLFKPGDAAALAQSLKTGLLNPDQRDRLGRNALTWARTHFTTREMCRRTLALYQQLCSDAYPGKDLQETPGSAGP
jgi:glycosyltransferase involved in cell wall biosynthesis